MVTASKVAATRRSSAVSSVTATSSGMMGSVHPSDHSPGEMLRVGTAENVIRNGDLVAGGSSLLTVSTMQPTNSGGGPLHGSLDEDVLLSDDFEDDGAPLSYGERLVLGTFLRGRSRPYDRQRQEELAKPHKRGAAANSWRVGDAEPTPARSGIAHSTNSRGFGEVGTGAAGNSVAIDVNGPCGGGRPLPPSDESFAPMPPPSSSGRGEKVCSGKRFLSAIAANSLVNRLAEPKRPNPGKSRNPGELICLKTLQDIRRKSKERSLSSTDEACRRLAMPRRRRPSSQTPGEQIVLLHNIRSVGRPVDNQRIDWLAQAKRRTASCRSAVRPPTHSMGMPARMTGHDVITSARGRNLDRQIADDMLEMTHYFTKQDNCQSEIPVRVGEDWGSARFSAGIGEEHGSIGHSVGDRDTSGFGKLACSGGDFGASSLASAEVGTDDFGSGRGARGTGSGEGGCGAACVGDDTLRGGRQHFREGHGGAGVVDSTETDVLQSSRGHGADLNQRHSDSCFGDTRRSDDKSCFASLPRLEHGTSNSSPGYGNSPGLSDGGVGDTCNYLSGSDGCNASFNDQKGVVDGRLFSFGGSQQEDVAADDADEVDEEEDMEEETGVPCDMHNSD
eukprot:TRINITY_DN56572_c0_g1_i1.p1 TRINITY_DN56572_c0_g1~~TRINITY_DN56572_c0_g1_i1.p1  ORF type:complete len:617 (+),score=107.28 TRINITY_DN56572_c0_g1_i1:97-1947(+)